MKTVFAWLVVLLAVLVPATASVMAPVFSPQISATKQARMGLQTHSSKALSKHSVVKGTAQATHIAKAGTHRKSTAGNSHAEHCSECGPCNACSASCGTAGSMAAACGGPLLPGKAAGPLMAGPADGQPQFISGGQYRPPRPA